MAGNLLGIATSGLRAAQRSLSTTGHNIANVNTEGYSRQRVETTERDPSFEGGNYFGNGVDIASVRRIYDSFLDNQVRLGTAAHAERDAFYRMVSEADNFLADEDASLTPSLQAFFDSVQGVANDPTSVAARRVLLTEGETLADRVNTLSGRLDSLREQVTLSLDPTIREINSHASAIADLNERIVAAQGKAGGEPPNDLLDQRKLLVEKLAGKIDTSVYELKDGAINVFVAGGQSLVMGTTANQMQVRESPYDPRDRQVVITAGSASTSDITRTISGGELGGLLRFSRQVLDPVQNGLGRIAAGLAVTFNAQHRAGADLDGNPGTHFFTDATDTATNRLSWFSKTTNTGNAEPYIAFDNSPGNGPAELSDSDYRLDYDGSAYTLTRLSDNTSVTDAAGNFAVDGLSISIGAGTAAAGDSFLLRPLRNLAGNLQANLSDPRQIAAGTYPADGPGDNGNALALAQLQSGKSLLGGKSTFQNAYTDLVGRVGTVTHGAEIDRTAQKKLLDQTVQSRESVSGVNLDEEAANLLRFQQAYQASAQLIQVTNSIFDALIGAVRS